MRNRRESAGRRRGAGLVWACALLWGAAPSARGGVEPPPAVLLPHAVGSIVVDGELGEEAWASAAVVDRFYEIVPGDTATPPVQTVGLLAYDSRYLYVGARCQDPDPSRIRAPYVDRDRVFDQDLVQIDIDARDEGRWSMIFRVNPRGVQADGVFDEATGADDYSPDFHFESAARITASGWTAEMRIPLSSLRYRARDPQTWRIAFFRLYPRDLRYQIASAPIPRGANCWLCYSPRYTGLTDLPSGGGVAYAPFVTGGASRATAGGEASERHAAAGADVKWLPRPNLAVDVALNPDFSQVESDVPQIGINTRFALFYPEKRPFFQEGLDLWNSPIRAVHTRTITQPDWGARVTGRPGSSSYTVLAAGDQGGGSLVIPGPASSSRAPQPEDSVVLLGRYRRSFGRSSLGGLFTDRERGGDYFNRVAGLDFQWYPGASDHVVGQILWSTTRDRGASRDGGHALFLGWDRSQRHLGLSFQVEDLARGFRADNGFVPQVGVRHVNATAGYALYPQTPIRKIRPQISYDEVREPGGFVVSRASPLGLAIDGRLQASMEWHPRELARALDGRPFEQDYWTAAAKVLPGRRLSSLSVTARRGDEIDLERSRLGTGTALGVAATLNPGERLQAELTGERRWLDLQGGRTRLRAFTAAVARAKVTYTFSSRSFARLVGEWVDEREGARRDPQFGGSLLYGYRLNWQSTLYVGYGDTAASPGGPGGGREQEVFVKIAYAFRP